MNIHYRADESAFSFYTSDNTAKRLVCVSEDLFFALDGLVEALKSDHSAREAYAQELMDAESVLRSAMPVIGGQVHV